MRLELVAVCVALVACRSKSTDGSPAEATSEYRGIATANAPSTEDPKLHVARKVDAGPRTGRNCHYLDGTRTPSCGPRRLALRLRRMTKPT